MKVVFPKMKKFPREIFEHFPLQSLKNKSIAKCHILFLSSPPPPITGKSQLENGKMKPIKCVLKQVFNKNGGTVMINGYFLYYLHVFLVNGGIYGRATSWLRLQQALAIIQYHEGCCEGAFFLRMRCSQKTRCQ